MPDEQDAEKNKKAETKEKDKKKKKKRKKVAAFVVTPILVAMAPSIPTAAASIVKTIVESQTPIVQPQFPGNDGFIFANDWRDAGGLQSSRKQAIELADAVIKRIYEKHVTYYSDDHPAVAIPPFAERRPFIQWILAGGMTPSEAEQSLNSSEAPESFNELVEQIQKFAPGATLSYEDGTSYTPISTKHEGRPVTVATLRHYPSPAKEATRVEEQLSSVDHVEIQWMNTEGQATLHADPDSEAYAEVETSTNLDDHD